LNGVVDIRQIHTLLQHLVFIYIDELLWHARDKCCDHVADLGAFASSCHEFGQVIRKKLDIFASAVLKDKRNPSGSADARYRRWRETEDRPFWQLPKLLIQTHPDGLILFGLGFAVLPGFQSHEEKRVI
jgi:hypothetical protein